MARNLAVYAGARVAHLREGTGGLIFRGGNCAGVLRSVQACFENAKKRFKMLVFKALLAYAIQNLKSDSYSEL